MNSVCVMPRTVVVANRSDSIESRERWRRTIDWGAGVTLG